MLFAAVHLFVTGLDAVITRAPKCISLVLRVLWVVLVCTILAYVVAFFLLVEMLWFLLWSHEPHV